MDAMADHTKLCTDCDPDVGFFCASCKAALGLLPEQEAHAENDYRNLIACPVSHVRALAYAASMIHLLRARNEGIGTTSTYFVHLVRTQFSADRFRMKMVDMTRDEDDVIDAASKLTWRYAVKDARKRGLPILRQRRHRGAWLMPCVVIEHTAVAS